MKKSSPNNNMPISF